MESTQKSFADMIPGLEAMIFQLSSSCQGSPISPIDHLVPILS